MGMRRIYAKTCVMLVTALCCVLLLPSCIGENTPCSPEKDGGYELNLSISAGRIGTKTGNQEDDKGISDENFIDVTGVDYCIFIVDGDENKNTILEQFKPDDIELTQSNGDYSVYNLKGTFKPVSDAVKIMVMANWKSFGENYPAPDGLIGKKLTDLYSDGVNYNFDYPDPDAKSWKPVSGNAGIPMFGLSEKIQLYPAGTTASGNYGPIPPEMVTDPIPMLRALAKIEVANFTNKENIKITACRLTKYNKQGRLIPDGTKNPDWNKEPDQVTEPSMPGGTVGSGVNLSFVQSTDEKGNELFMAYIPEMLLDPEKSRPVIEVDITQDGSTSNTYKIELAQYGNNGKPTANYYPDLLRNHCYRFNVTGVGVNADLPLTVETPEWDVDDDQEWTYEDAAVGFADDFKWINPKYEQIIDDPERILLTGYSEEDASYGSFRFKPLSANNSCTWTISLIADDDTKNDHFTIQIKKNTAGEEWEDCGDTVTRELDSDMVEFRIMATAANGSTVDYTARVVMTVQTFDGRVAILNLTGTEDYDPSNKEFYYVVKQLTNGGDNM